MNISPEPDDIEPLDAVERLHKAYGHYHIGRDDETRRELALFFDTRCLPEPDFLDIRLWSIVNRNDGRLHALSEYASSEHTDDYLRELLHRHVKHARVVDGLPCAHLAIAIVELVKPAVWNVDRALRVYTAYVGYSDISWPSSFRSIIIAKQNFL